MDANFLNVHTDSKLLILNPNYFAIHLEVGIINNAKELILKYLDDHNLVS